MKGNIFRSLKSVFSREDHICPWWLAYSFDNPLRKFLHDPEAMLSNYVKEGMTVADIGCGMGYFSLAMAKMVGTGTVIAVDIQQEMLDILRKRAEKRSVVRNIRLVHAEKDDIGIKEPVDFVLAFWMVHETGNIRRFLGQVSSVLKQGGTMLVAEPRLHVSSKKFQETLQQARDAGFEVSEGPKVGLSRSAVLTKFLI
jgi:ubiquinone/menaquinone biosynthesis C-methylase UbiE